MFTVRRRGVSLIFAQLATGGGVRRRNGDRGAEGGGGKRGERAEGSRREAAEGDTRGK